MIYSKDKTNRITLRLSAVQFDYVRQNADNLGVSPSDFLRLLVNGSMTADKVARQAIARATSHILNLNERKGNGRENDKANSNHLVQQ